MRIKIRVKGNNYMLFTRDTFTYMDQERLTELKDGERQTMQLQLSYATRKGNFQAGTIIRESL